MPLKEFKVAMDDLVMKLKQNPGKKPGMTLLKDFSPWLSGFHAYQYTETVEIPGIVLYVCARSRSHTGVCVCGRGLLRVPEIIFLLHPFVIIAWCGYLC